MQASAKFCEVFPLEISFRYSQTCSALFVDRASTFIIFRPTNFYLFAYLRAKVGRKNTTSVSRFVSVKGTQSFPAVQLSRANTVNVIEHARSVYQYDGRLWDSISSINYAHFHHAHYTLRLISVSTSVTWKS